MDIQEISNIAVSAGEAIMNIYDDPERFASVYYKEDNSPLTLADTASNRVIVERLQDIYPEVPIISEEGKEIGFETRREWDNFWLVDPLDGTKEFIRRNGEFTVNIAWVQGNRPILGVIYAPATRLLYYGTETGGAFKKEEKGVPKALAVNRRKENRVAVRSRSHANPAEETVLSDLDVVDSVSIGSSLKFCLVAQGTADVYYRHGPTMEWDIAAGQAIVTAAGGKVVKGTSDQEFTFNKPDLRNGSFLCLGF